MERRPSRRCVPPLEAPFYGLLASLRLALKAKWGVRSATPQTEWSTVVLYVFTVLCIPSDYPRLSRRAMACQTVSPFARVLGAWAAPTRYRPCLVRSEMETT